MLLIYLFFVILGIAGAQRCPTKCRMTENGCFCPFLWDRPRQDVKPQPTAPPKRSLNMRRFELIHEGVVGGIGGRIQAHPIRRQSHKRDYTPEAGYDSAPITAPLPPIESSSVNPYIPPPPPLASGKVVKTGGGTIPAAQLSHRNDNMPSAVPDTHRGAVSGPPVEVSPADIENPAEVDDIGIAGEGSEEILDGPDGLEGPAVSGEIEETATGGTKNFKSKVPHHQKPILPAPPQQPLVWMPEIGGGYKPQLGQAGGQDGATDDEDRTVIIEVPNGAPQPDHYLPPPEAPSGKVSELPARFNFILPKDDTPDNPGGTVPKNPALLAKGSLKPKQSKVYDIVVSDGKGTPSPRTTTTTTTEPPFEVAPPFLGDPQLLSAVTGLLSAGALLPALGLADGAPPSFGGLGGAPAGGSYPSSPYGRPLAYLPNGGGNGGAGGGTGTAGFTEITGQTKDGFSVRGAGGINNSGVSGFFVPENEGNEERRSTNSQLVIGGPPIGTGSAGSINGETIAEINPGSFPGSRITSLGEAWGGINPFQWDHGVGTPVPQTPN